MNFFEKFKSGLKKTGDFLNDGVNSIVGNLIYFDEKMLDELEELLIMADIGFKTVAKIMEILRAEIIKTGSCSKDKVLLTLEQSLYDALGETAKLILSEDKLNLILMVGVNGTGKTTSSGKLAYRYVKAGKKVMLAAADTFRAAAVEQLQEWSVRAGCDFIKKENGADPASVVYEAIDKALSRDCDLLIVDTAGRLHNKQNLMAELEKIHRIIAKKSEKINLLSLLVIDATTGQNALVQTKYFNEVCHLDGLILTKLDGNSKGGVAVAVCEESKLPLYMAGLGEAIDDLIDFDKASFVKSLIPRAENYMKFH